MLNAYQLLKSGTSLAKSVPQETPATPAEQLWDPAFDSKLQFIEDLHLTSHSRELNHHCHSMLTLIKRNRISFVGRRIRVPVSTLESVQALFGVSQQAVDALRAKFGVERLTLTQQFAIPQVFSGRNTLMIAPTGSGKTLAYALPLLHTLQQQGSNALLLCPTFELSVQIYQVISRLAVNGGFGLRVEHLHALKAEELGAVRVVVGTPDRTLKFLDDAAAAAWLAGLGCVVMDEADRFFELNCMAQLEGLLAALQQSRRQWLLFSATLPRAIEDAIDRVFADKAQVVINGRLNVLGRIDQRLVFCSTEEGKLLELENLVNAGELRLPCIVFAQTRLRVRRVFAVLRRWGIFADFLDGALSLDERRAKIERFKAGETLVLITTDVLARGIDVAELQTVINFDVAPNCVTHVHRVGRTARGAGKGVALTFFTPGDRPLVRKVAEMMFRSGCAVPDWIMKLKMPSKSQVRQFEKAAGRRERIDGSGGEGREVRHPRRPRKGSRDPFTSATGDLHPSAQTVRDSPLQTRKMRRFSRMVGASKKSM